jgi:hypothetical protein
MLTARHRRMMHMFAVSAMARTAEAAGELIDEAGAALGGAVAIEDFEAAVMRVVRKQQSNDAAAGAAGATILPTEPPLFVENHWRAERLREHGGRFFTFVDWFWETDAPIIAVAIGVLGVTALIAYAGPELIRQTARIVRAPERPARLLAFAVLIFVVLFGVSGVFSIFQTGFLKWVLAFGVFGLAFGYGLGVEISNITGGILLPFNSAVQIGKELSLMDNGEKKTGIVESIGLRYTTIIREREDGKRVRTWLPNHLFTNNSHDETLPETEPVPLPVTAAEAAPKQYVFDLRNKNQ